MSRLSREARYWVNDREVEGAEVRIVDIPSGRGITRRTGIVHTVADAAEITVDEDTVLVARWICGASTVDAEAASEDTEASCVTCRIAAAIPMGPVVYFAWGKGDELLYVGSSINAPARIRNHMNQTEWWPDVRRLTHEKHPTEAAARSAELEHIAQRPGTHNVEGRRERRIMPLPFLDGSA